MIKHKNYKENMSSCVSLVTLTEQNEESRCCRLLFERVINYLVYFSKVSKRPVTVVDLFADNDEAKRLRSGPVKGPLNIPTCALGVTKDGFGIGGAAFAGPFHWGANPCAKTGVPPHSDESSGYPMTGKHQRAWQQVVSLSHCTRTLWVLNLKMGRHEHLSYDHYKAWWGWMVETGRFSTGFIARLNSGGKVNWPDELVSAATFEEFRVNGTDKYIDLRITLRSPPPELCPEFQGGKMQGVTVSFLAGSPHAGPLGERGSKSYRHVLFYTAPDENNCYISDKTEKPYASKKNARPRKPPAPGELENALHDLRVEVDAILDQHNEELDRSSLMDTVAGFECRYVTKTGQPLTMMDGSSHRYFVRRLLLVVFSQPTVGAMRATLWGAMQKEIDSAAPPRKRKRDPVALQQPYGSAANPILL